MGLNSGFKGLTCRMASHLQWIRCRALLVVICEDLESCNTVFRYTFLPAGYSVLRCSGSWCSHNLNKTSDSCLKNPQHESCFLLPLQLQTPVLHYTKGGEKSCSERNTSTAVVHCTDASCLQKSVGYSSVVNGTRMFTKVFATVSHCLLFWDT